MLHLHKVAGSRDQHCVYGQMSGTKFFNVIYQSNLRHYSKRTVVYDKIVIVSIVWTRKDKNT
jgi:hypothetical protein